MPTIRRPSVPIGVVEPERNADDHPESAEDQAVDEVGDDAREDAGDDHAVCSRADRRGGAAAGADQGTTGSSAG